MTESIMATTCSSFVGHFDGHGSPPVQYEAHRPIKHVQGYFGSHWMPASGDYSLHIASAATRATGKQTTIHKYTYKAGRFDGHGNAPVRNRAHCPMEKVQGFTRSQGCHHQASIMSNNIKRTWLRWFFMFSSSKP
jgi:hypothetical protein